MGKCDEALSTENKSFLYDIVNIQWKRRERQKRREVRACLIHGIRVENG